MSLNNAGAQEGSSTTEPASPNASRSVTRRRWLGYLGIAAVFVWTIAVGAGVGRIWKYKNTPGAATAAPATWPGSALISPPGQTTLVMFVHPRCPCSRASLTELSQIMEREQGRTAAWVMFLRPVGTTENWERTPTWKAAQGLPGVAVLTDATGAEAARFGVSTSGHVVLYDAKGHLLFSGGITGSRGHVGDNSGQQSVVSLLEGRPAEQTGHPVYGCGFHDQNPPPDLESAADATDRLHYAAECPAPGE